MGATVRCTHVAALKQIHAANDAQMRAQQLIC